VGGGIPPGGSHGGLSTLTRRTGSSHYLAPENYNEEAYTTKVDIFSLGIVLWELLSARRAYGELRVSADRIMRATARDGLRPLIPRRWPRRLQLLVEQLWADEADDRPDAAALVGELEALLRAARENPTILDGVRIQRPRRRRSCAAGCVIS
jgi:serine/threonine protein kinase